MDQQKWRPGEEAPESGSYFAYDEQGHNGGTVHLNKGDRFPATQHSGSYYTKVTNE
ncbi:MAG: YjzC family protein [Clostridia bacterium]|nr:YjzC family protein [Clostridia bacterium]